MYTPAPLRPGICPCGAQFHAHGNRKYCSERCRNRAGTESQMFPCAGCAKPMYVCRAAVAADARAYRVQVMERTGVSLSAKRKTPHTWISAKVRFAVYERDNWICQLCAEPVDRTLHPNARFAASLDHIECKSWALIPDHSPANLRLAHRSCNARRKDRVAA